MKLINIKCRAQKNSNTISAFIFSISLPLGIPAKERTQFKDGLLLLPLAPTGKSASASEGIPGDWFGCGSSLCSALKRHKGRRIATGNGFRRHRLGCTLLATVHASHKGGSGKAEKEATRETTSTTVNQQPTQRMIASCQV